MVIYFKIGILFFDSLLLLLITSPDTPNVPDLIRALTFSCSRAQLWKPGESEQPSPVLFFVLWKAICYHDPFHNMQIHQPSAISLQSVAQ